MEGWDMKVKTTKFRGLAVAGSIALAACMLFAAPAAAQTKGGGNELLVGTIQDLSGPLAAYGKSVRDGMNLRVAEVNEQGGVNGRRLKLLVEDSGYDPRRAVLAAQRLVKQEKAFVMLGVLGTFALPPVEGGPVEIHARCMVCDRRAVAPVEAGAPLDAARKVALARKALREAGCTHTKST